MLIFTTTEMKQCKYSQLPVPIPAPASKISELARFARECRTAIIALRDRRVLAPNGNSEALTGSHPWKCVSNGGDIIKIGAGKLIGMRWASGSGYPLYGQEISYAGEDFQVSISSGYLCAVSVAGEDLVGTQLLHVYPSGAISIEEATSPSAILESGAVSVPICKFTLTDGVATITEQILFDNPTISGCFEASV